MNTYRRYQDARDMAWRALLQLKSKLLPVDALELARGQGMEIHPWVPDGKQPRLEQLLQQMGGGPCKSLRIRGVWHIFYDPRALSENGVRFAVAHELGHFFLSHETKSLMPGVRRYCSPENAGDLLENPLEMDDYAADIFAIRLLAPACLLHELHVDSLGGIMQLCGLPPRAAALRAERMELLNQRDAFFTHPLERQVRDAFLPFLRERQFPVSGEAKGQAAETEDAAPWEENAAAPEAMQPLLTPASREKTPEKIQEKMQKKTPEKTKRRRRIPARAWRWILPLLAFFAAFLIWYGRNMQ